MSEQQQPEKDYAKGLAEGVRTYADRSGQREEIRESLDQQQPEQRLDRAEIRTQALRGDLGPEVQALSEAWERLPWWRPIRKRRLALQAFWLIYPQRLRAQQNARRRRVG